MKKWSVLVILMCCISLSKEDCFIISRFKSIECVNTSVDHYFYEILKAMYSYEFTLDLGANNLNNISISHSSFDHIRYIRDLLIPSLKINNSPVTFLEIKNSNVRLIEPYAFMNLRNLEILDLSHNELKEISFTFSLNSVRSLILSNNKIEIQNLDLNFYNQALMLDLSYNNIKTLLVTCYTESLRSEIKTSIILNLAYNKIKDISFSEEFCWYENINLEGNDNFSSNSERITNLFGIHMSFPNRKTKTSPNLRGLHIFNISNSILIKLDKTTFDTSRFDYVDVDFRNCSLTEIDTNVFENAKINKLFLGDNNLINVTQSIFNFSKVKYLDISNSNIKNVDKIFKGLSCNTLILKSNIINRLSLKSFDEIKFVKELDISFNNLVRLENSSFVNCYDLKALNISFNNLSIIEVMAFYSLRNLESLDLSYNNIIELIPGIFTSLERLKYLNLERSLQHNIKFGVFFDLPIEILNLKLINFSFLEENTFFVLPKLKQLSMPRVNNISSKAFKNLPNLELLDIGLVDNLNFSDNSIQTYIKTLRFRGDTLFIVRSKSFLDLVNLNKLLIYATNLEIERDAFFGLFQLEYLSFDMHYERTNILNFDVHCLRGLFNLKYFEAKVLFRNVKIVEKGIFDDLCSIINLDLGDLDLTKIERYAFNGLQSLRNLTLSSNAFSLLLNDSFVGLHKLKFLNISFSNIVDIENFTFYGMESLLMLDLQGNNLKNLSDSKFDLNLLEKLNLENCKISKLSKNVFKHLRNLKFLNLKNNLIDQVDDLQVNSFANIPSLLDLNLAGNFIDDLKVGIFSNLGLLKNLNLANNNITKFAIEVFIPLKSLENLRLDNNHLKTFNVLSFLPYAQNLKHLGMSQNKLPCDKLSTIIKMLRTKNISYKPNQPTFELDNIEGIECVDVCKFLFCLKDTHGIN